jgi:hypothetical protein
MNFRISFYLTVIFLVGVAAGQMPTNAPASVELRDQFDSPQKMIFPTTNITLLTIADWKGSEQIRDWVTPLKKKYGERLKFCGIADVSAVPRLLRGMIRRQFQKSQSYPVMLDWSGDTVNAFGFSANKANVLILDHSGWILKRLAGAADDASLSNLCATLDELLPATSSAVVPKN